MNSLFDIVYHIRSCRDRLSSTEQKVADAILADIGFAAAATIDQIAAKASVSVATISRFSKSVGCTDIRDLKLKLAQANAVGSRFLSDASSEATSTEESAFYTRICSEVENNLRANLAGFVEADFQQAVKYISAARMTYIAGMGGGSTIIAQETQFRLARLGFAAAAYHDPIILRMLAATMTANDVLIILSLSGVTPELLSIAAIAHEYGARIIVITQPQSALAKTADLVIPITTDETDFIYKPSASRYGMLFAVDVLATELALSRRDQSKELLRRVKFALDEHRGGSNNRLPLGD